ncbi:hypothetical protein RFI_16344 [Reticulomyxa filosa]|uniref:Uncharacterized protein n=1 Tax=Reticulomyxa filosa TaxID=46433 RepID=X6N557_RETFI|nr:hypothetical protein RFI_16344 [Reticulomyxa filosa]|eukprot:ETO20864.1 hypothetical protein RFI_16344 [Reticulomyxa filosa]
MEEEVELNARPEPSQAPVVNSTVVHDVTYDNYRNNHDVFFFVVCVYVWYVEKKTMVDKGTQQKENVPWKTLESSEVDKNVGKARIAFVAAFKTELIAPKPKNALPKTQHVEQHWHRATMMESLQLHNILPLGDIQDSNKSMTDPAEWTMLQRCSSSLPSEFAITDVNGNASEGQQYKCKYKHDEIMTPQSEEGSRHSFSTTNTGHPLLTSVQPSMAPPPPLWNDTHSRASMDSKAFERERGDKYTSILAELRANAADKFVGGHAIIVEEGNSNGNGDIDDVDIDDTDIDVDVNTMGHEQWHSPNEQSSFEQQQQQQQQLVSELRNLEAKYNTMELHYKQQILSWQHSCNELRQQLKDQYLTHPPFQHATNDPIQLLCVLSWQLANAKDTTPVQVQETLQKIKEQVDRISSSSSSSSSSFPTQSLATPPTQQQPKLPSPTSPSLPSPKVFTETEMNNVLFENHSIKKD